MADRSLKLAPDMKTNARAVDRFDGESDDELTGRGRASGSFSAVSHRTYSRSARAEPPWASTTASIIVAKREGPAWFSGVSPVCKSIIGINVAVFLLDQLINRGNNTPFIDAYLAASPDGTLHHFRIWELLTATFLHVDIWHLLGNMWFFWIVGREMESLYGSRDFLAFYLCAAIFSTLAWVLIDAASNPDPTTGHGRRFRGRHGHDDALHAVLPQARDPVFLYSDADVAPGCSLLGLPPDPGAGRTIVAGRRRGPPGRGWFCIPLQAVRLAVVAVVLGACVQAEASDLLARSS